MSPKPGRAIVPQAFDYSGLEDKVARQVQGTAARIRARVKQSLDAALAVGNDLLAVKEALPHGQFGPWLRAEFGWTGRTARNFMAVAERFGPKTAMISDLAISATAAYLLAAPSAPDEAREAALERAAAGERITPAVARDILARLRKKGRALAVVASAHNPSSRVWRALARCKERLQPQELAALARELRAFADGVEQQQAARKEEE